MVHGLVEEARDILYSKLMKVDIDAERQVDPYPVCPADSNLESSGLRHPPTQNPRVPRPATLVARPRPGVLTLVFGLGDRAN
jgi:hypothetical protein